MQIDEAVSTDDFISDVVVTREYSAPYSPSLKGELFLAAYHHARWIKVAKVALTAFGVAAILSSSFSIFAIGRIVMGSAAILTAFVAHQYLPVIAPPKHDMTTHVFKEETFRGAKLYYQGDVPILTLEEQDPYEAGFAQGYLLAEQMKELREAIDIAFHQLMGRSRAAEVTDVLREIENQIPLNYLKEMEGMIAGYNFRYPNSSISLDELILLNLMPDSVHFSPGALDDVKEPLFQVACTALIGGTEETGPIFGRNMDWPSFGVSGKSTFILHRKNQETGLATAEVAIPGLVGTLTGMNSAGLALAMNVCCGQTTEVLGIPAGIYNRMCLETATTVMEAEAFAEKYPSLGPYHLTLADRERAVSVHLLQGEEGSHVVRSWEYDPLVTTNFRYEGDEVACDFFRSGKRHLVLEQYFSDAKESIDPERWDWKKIITRALQLPFVSNKDTTHAVLMEPKHFEMWVAFDNAWAATRSLHRVDLESLFS